MLEILSAIKNNNVNKIPTSSEQCYSTYIDHVQKVIRTYYKYNKTPAELTISYEDLLNGWCNVFNFTSTLKHNNTAKIMCTSFNFVEIIS